MGGPLYRRPPHFDTPQNFVKFCIFFIFAYLKNFTRLASVVKKFELCRLRLRETPHFSISKFCQILSFLYIYLPEKFHVSSLKGEKV